LALVLLPTSAGESSRRWTNRYRSRIHERANSLRFLGIIFRVLQA
jgi:hypothetical protein